MLPNPIYALCDAELLKRFNYSLLQYLSLIKKFHIIYIQYRDKINSLDIQKQNILFLKKHTKIPIIINDQLSLLKFADGIHLGQEDIDNLIGTNKQTSLKLVRKKYPNKIIGISTHNEIEILEANTFDIDYIGLGAYRNSNTKNVTTILGDKISYLAQISIHSVGAIGGVKVSDQIPHISFNVIGSDLWRTIQK